MHRGSVISGVDRNKYESVTAGGDGIIYAMDSNGDLFWPKDCADDGTVVRSYYPAISLCIEVVSSEKRE
jgi:hypothetical protein